MLWEGCQAPLSAAESFLQREEWKVNPPDVKAEVGQAKITLTNVAYPRCEDTGSFVMQLFFMVKITL